MTSLGAGDSTIKTEEAFIEVVGGSLVALSENGQPASAAVPIETEPRVIGRDPNCHVPIADQHMSASHCTVAATPEGVCITDSSKNGTWVNQVRLKPGNSAYLLQNARFLCGRTWFEVQVTGREHVPISGAIACGPLVGRSAPMRELYARIERIAPTPINVLITGETGTGKELVAQAIHELSGRTGRMITIDCTAIPPSLAESVLFGHEKGAFTGAVSRLRSPFLEATGGTVFMDELGELPDGLQPKLLRALEARQIQAVGSNRYEPIDVRVVAATRRDLHAEMNAGRFRQDLYFRFAQRVLEVPALRRRTEDIPDLVARFLLGDLDDPGALGRIDKPEMDRLQRYDWPGNVRELRNVVLTAHVEAAGGPIGFAELLSPRAAGLHLSDRIDAGRSFAVQKDEMVNAFIREYFTRLHAETGGNLSAISRRSGLSRGQARTHLRRLGLHEDE